MKKRFITWLARKIGTVIGNSARANSGDNVGKNFARELIDAAADAINGADQTPRDIQRATPVHESDKPHPPTAAASKAHPGRQGGRPV